MLKAAAMPNFPIVVRVTIAQRYPESDTLIMGISPGALDKKWAWNGKKIESWFFSGKLLEGAYSPKTNDSVSFSV